MLEDKTTETRQDEPAAAPRHSGFRARLRSRWAQLQCVRLLRRHRRYPPSAATGWTAPPGSCGLVAAGGAHRRSALRTGLWRGVCCRAGRDVPSSTPLSWAVRRHPPLCKRLWPRRRSPGAAQVVKDLFGPFVLLAKGIVALLIHAHQHPQGKGPSARHLKASAHYFASGVRRNLRLLPRMAMYALPVCALALGSSGVPICHPPALCAGRPGQRRDRGLCGE